MQKKNLISKEIKETKREGQPKGQKKREKKKIVHQHKLNEGEERKIL